MPHHMQSAAEHFSSSKRLASVLLYIVLPHCAFSIIHGCIGYIGKRGHGHQTTDIGQTMEKTDNDGKDGQTMEKTDKRWKRRTNDGKDGRVFSYI